MKNKINTKMIVYIGFLLTIALLLGGGIKRMTGIPISLSLDFGGAKHSIDFTSIPLAMAGLILGPIGALIMGFSYDNIYFLLFQIGAVYNPVFSIADTCAAILPAIYFKYLVNKELKKKRTKDNSLLIILFLIVYTFIAIILSSFLSDGLKSQQQFTIISFNNGIEIINYYLLFIILGIMLISIFVFLFLNKRKKKLYLVNNYNDNLTFDKIYMISILTVLPRTLISGIALYFHYTYIMNTPIPLIYFLIQRLISAIVLIPITAIILFALKPIIKRNTMIK